MSPGTVTETFFSLDVRDMERAMAFYIDALGATLAFSSPHWSSLVLAGVRIGLALNEEHPGGPVGLHFAVDDLKAASARVERAGGCIASSPIPVAPDVVIVRCEDTERNMFTLTGSKHRAPARA